jgi:hypothetical protein
VHREHAVVNRRLQQAGRCRQVQADKRGRNSADEKEEGDRAEKQ